MPATRQCPTLVIADIYSRTVSGIRGILDGNRLGPCTACPLSQEGDHPQLGAKVDSFLQVRLARREFSADGEVPSPSSAPARHAYLKLCFKILREELLAQFLQPPLEMFVHSMANNVEEPVVATCLSYAGCNL